MNTLSNFAYARPGFINLPEYATVGALSAVNTTNFSDNTQVIIPSGKTFGSPPLGIYTFKLGSNLPLVANNILAAAGNNGQWIRTPEAGLVINDSTANNVRMSLDISNAPGPAQYTSKANITFQGLITQNITTTPFIISTPGSLVADFATATVVSYSNAGALNNGLILDSAASPGQMQFSSAAVLGASVLFVTTMTLL